MERCELSLRIQSEYGKIRIKKTPNTGEKKIPKSHKHFTLMSNYNFLSLTLIWVGWGVILHRQLGFWVKAITLAFYSIQYHFIKNFRAKFGILYSSQFLDIEQDSGGGISNFRISGQSLMKRNSRTSDDIHMESGPVTKIDKKNKRTSKN